MQRRNRDADIENEHEGMGERMGVMNWEIKNDIHELPLLK